MRPFTSALVRRITTSLNNRPTRRSKPRLVLANLEDRTVPSAPAAPPGYTSSLTTFTNTTAVPISTSVAQTYVHPDCVGVDTYLHDLTTFLRHTSNSQLDITLTSPAGTVVTIGSANGGANDDVYNGTLWDDDADPGNVAPYTAANSNLVTDTAYTNGAVEAALTPEEPLGAFIGENPNGTWTLTIRDRTNADGGSLDSWKLNVTTLGGAVNLLPTQTFSATPNLTSPETIATVSTTMVVSGANSYLQKLTVQTGLTHTFNSDLNSPSRPGRV